MTIEELEALVQNGWTLVCAALVLFMQAGFCCLEAGSVRHKNSINVALKNMVDLCVSCAAFFVVGYSVMFGASVEGLHGLPSLFLHDLERSQITSFLFQVTFCATAATIVSGGIAERCRFLPYVLVAVVVGLFIYPVFGHWVWGGGWLSKLGYHDFAGSSVVHMVGAGVALAGIQILGARRGRFDAQGRAQRIPASSMPLVALGVIILLFGWIGFNGGSAALGTDTATIITNTLLAACFGGLGALLLTWAYGGLAAVDLVLNGILGGLVAITAGADCVSLQASCIIGLAGGGAVVLGSRLLERARLDDAVGAVPVHGVAGVVGVILATAMAEPEYLAAWNETRAEHGNGELSRMGLVGVQALGVAVCIAWSYLTGLLLWWIVSRITPLRVGSFEEQVGMNYSEHQVADPIQDLAAAMVAAAGGKPVEELRPRLDNTGDGEVATLAAALRSFLEIGEQRRLGLDRAVGGLTELRARIADHGAEGEGSTRRCLDALDLAAGSMERILSFLDGAETDPRTLPLLRDLIASCRERLSTLAVLLPGHLGVWASVAHTGDRLDRALAELRGAAR